MGKALLKNSKLPDFWTHLRTVSCWFSDTVLLRIARVKHKLIRQTIVYLCREETSRNARSPGFAAAGTADSVMARAPPSVSRTKFLPPWDPDRSLRACSHPPIRGFGAWREIA